MNIEDMVINRNSKELFPIVYDIDNGFILNKEYFENKGFMLKSLSYLKETRSPSVNAIIGAGTIKVINRGVNKDTDIETRYSLSINGELPIKHKDDLAYFKHKTIGDVVVMGRKTWESIPINNRPLSDRLNIIISNRDDFLTEEEKLSGNILVRQVQCADEFIQLILNTFKSNIWIIGGNEIYRLFKEQLDKVYLVSSKQFLSIDKDNPELNDIYLLDIDLMDHPDSNLDYLFENRLPGDMNNDLSITIFANCITYSQSVSVLNKVIEEYKNDCNSLDY